MFFRKKNAEGGFASKNLRRRFHHLLLKKRRGDLPKTILAKTRSSRPLRSPPSPTLILIRRLFGFFAIGAILIGLFYVIFFSSFFTITKVALEKNGSGAVSSTQLAPFLEKIKGKNLLFLQSNKLTKELEQTFRNEVLIANIKKSYPNRVIVKVEEYPAVLNFRVFVNDAVQKLVLNQIGYAIFENAELEGLPILMLRTDKAFQQKTVVIPPAKLTVIINAFSKFQELFGLKIVEGEWKKTERELHLKTEKNFFVWLDLTGDIEQQLGKLKRALKKLDIYRDSLEYIDLRIAGADYEKVIFKKKR
ncbi:hypothetical protein HYW83_05325 [Candidatus Peregrinibacteria bacterium]|nr:hypothetical protein [Candidatus Peregrinibacteria bacterium]